MSTLTIEQAKERLTIRDIWRRLDLPGEPKASCKSPFREESKPSFSVSEDGRLWNDFSTGEGGDVVDFYQKATGLSRQEACRRFLEMAGGRVGDWFKEGDYGVIFGRRGLGKSWVAMGLARALAEGRSFGPWECPQARRVLYVDGEMSLDDYRNRVRLLSLGEGDMLTLSHQNVFDRTEKALCLSDLDQQEELTRLCEQEGVNVLFLDNGACLFRDVAENDADDFRDKIEGWLLDLRRRGVAVVLVLHAGRNGAIRGTSKREDAAFWILRLDDAGEPEGEQGARFITRFVKNRNASQDPPPLDWHFTPTGDKVSVSYREADSMAIFRQWIADGLTTCAELAEEMGVSKGTISKMAKRAEHAGWLTIINRKYSLTNP